jgi:aryl-alcohol dehydrogenase-like predicted oxidoreductase
MRTRKLGRLALDVSELSLGTWGLSGDGYGPVSEKEQDSVIERALTLGITLFDTADCYGKGAMETKLGQRLPDDGTTRIVTKLGSDLESYPNRKRFDVPFLREAFERSRDRLKRSKLDIVLLHNPSKAALHRGEAAEFLEEQVRSGHLTGWGVSAGDAESVLASLRPSVKPHVVELAYNVFLTSDLIATAADLQHAGVGILARSVLAHGLLAGLWSSEKTFDADDHRIHRWTREQFRRRLHQLKAFSVLDRTRTPSSRAAAVNFVLLNDAVSSAVLGPRDVVQLDQLVREVAKAPPYLTGLELHKLDHQLREYGCE